MTQRNDSSQIVPIVIGLVVAAVGGFVLWRFADAAWLTLILVPLVLLGLHVRATLANPIRAAWIGLVCAIILGFGLNTANTLRNNISNPPEWDLRMFWVLGQVGARGENFYQPENALRIAEPFNPSEDFKTEIYFWYLPPTMLFLLPMGWFEINTAVAVWYGIHVAAMLACIYLLWRIFQRESGWVGLLVVAALVLVLPSTLMTLFVGQTNFLVLLFLLLFWGARDKLLGGLWLALGIFSKLYMAAFIGYLILRRKWRVIASTVVSLLLVSLVSLVVFGSDTFFSYFSENPNAHTPDYLYTETVNQSLLSTILRVTNYDFTGRSPLMNPIFIIGALVLTGITAFFLYRLDRSRDDLALLLTLALALLIYPASLNHYALLLIAPFLYIWKIRQELPGGVYGVTIITTVIFFLTGLGNGNYVFFANLLTWVVLVGISWYSLRQPIQSLKTTEPAAQFT